MVFYFTTFIGHESILWKMTTFIMVVEDSKFDYNKYYVECNFVLWPTIYIIPCNSALSLYNNVVIERAYCVLDEVVAFFYIHLSIYKLETPTLRVF